MRKRGLGVIPFAAAVVLAGALPALAQGSPQEQDRILSLEPPSARSVPTETLKRRAATLAQAFVPHVHRSATGERMPYRLFTPRAREKGRKCPLGDDPARIYVTGHSMGGAGTWHMIAQRPRFFAAAVPVCGHPLPATAEWVKDVPVWNFHGTADAGEPVATSRVTIEALRQAGGRPRHTEYPGIGHDVFMWAYTEPALVEWLFAQER